VIADCRSNGVAPFHKQWGSYQGNPLVVEQGLQISEAKVLDSFEKSGCLVDGKIIREYPMHSSSTNRRAA
jgi:hypothetical protein